MCGWQAQHPTCCWQGAARTQQWLHKPVIKMPIETMLTENTGIYMQGAQSDQRTRSTWVQTGKDDLHNTCPFSRSHAMHVGTCACAVCGANRASG
jgi:hypothetical protein